MTFRTPSEMISFQSLSADRIRAGLRTKRFGRKLLVYDQVESTNSTALALAEEGQPEGTVIIADSQTRGRGRLGRGWVSPPDLNLYMSVILRPEGDPGRTGLWTLAAAVAVARSIQQVTRLPARLKWPNDVRIHHKKVSGLLLEGALHQDRYKHLIIGVGINVNMSRQGLPESDRASATSLREELGRPVDRIELIQRFLECLEIQSRSVAEDSPKGVLEAYTALSETIGRDVVAHGPNRRWTGKAIGLSPEGALILMGTDHRQIVIHSHDIVHLRENHAARD